MYVKLFARITESSLMEQEISVRYTFVMLLALADPSGLVVGTDIALARRLNMPLKQFVKCAKLLQTPDEDSNSKEHEGRRIVVSEAERGYQIVNYAKYRDLQSEDERRAYMRDYMREYRSGKPSVNNVKNSKPELAKLTQAEADASASEFKEGGGEPNQKNSRMPSTESEAVMQADMENVPAKFAKEVFNHLEATEWADGAGRPITNWRRYIKNRWEKRSNQAPPPKRSGEGGAMTFMP
jgi:hypothetical protein